MGELGVAGQAFVILLFVASRASPCKDTGFIDLGQDLMGFSPVGSLGLVLTQSAGVHSYLFPLPGCMAEAPGGERR